MTYATKSFDSLVGLNGLSDALIQDHLTLYRGYVKNVNAIIEQLSGMDYALPQRAELQRRLGWEYDGMRLHEWYFENLCPTGAGNVPEECAPLLEEFSKIGAMRGIGWVMMYLDPQDHRLFNVWINEHDAGHPAGCVPILVMDAFEHAYLRDFGLNRADYIGTFMKLINWNVVSTRLQTAREA
jgi:Fe-Mn family superoxide dismutase